MSGSKGGMVRRKFALSRPHKLSKEATARFDAIRDKDIDYSDIPDTTEFWRMIEPIMPEPKAQITLRVDKDVLDFFKRQGKRYQTRMHAVLKAYVQAHKRVGAPIHRTTGRG
jgi:uncharacterized protein (DUF4415 family)